jgi:hypothetical protein
MNFLRITNLRNLAILLAGFFIYSNCTNQNESVFHKKVEALEFSDTLKVLEKLNLTESDSLFIRSPRRMFTVNDHFLILTELEPENFIHVFNLPDLDYLYSWGVNGKGPDEFQFPPGDFFVNEGNRFSIYDFAMGQIRYFQVSDTSIVKAADAKSMRYSGQFNYLAGITRLNDSLYIANFDETPMNDPDVEHIAIKTDDATPVSKFGEYPRSDVEGPGKLSLFAKTNITRPDGSSFASFYSNFNRFKIYNSDFKLIKDVEVYDLSVPDHNVSQTVDNPERIIYRYVRWASDELIFTHGMNETSENLWDNPIPSLTTFFEIWDWDGNQLFRAHFDRRVIRFAVSDNLEKIYALGEDPFEEIYVYDISEILQKLNTGF